MLSEARRVCDLTSFEMTQSKLSYHLKILLDAGLIVKQKVRGVIMI